MADLPRLRVASCGHGFRLMTSPADALDSIGTQLHLCAECRAALAREIAHPADATEQARESA